MVFLLDLEQMQEKMRTIAPEIGAVEADPEARTLTVERAGLVPQSSSSPVARVGR
ncbi:hypothetical protein [Halegenticoccus tardaugens]|uniref:hypothetical protein n=1 Tax=Halegenticoccus tardaugens TaxID=2071624 RepID=UPI0013E95BB6|nr:hypothetical protein [Halegenticoccus tardaugens]